MTVKKARLKAIRKIRKATGLSIPVCAEIAKEKSRCSSLIGLIISPPSSKDEGYTRKLAREAVSSITLCDCCGPERRVTGPKGMIQELDIPYF